MKSKQLWHLSRCNKKLAAGSWINYRTFLETLLRSIDSEVSRALLSHLENEEYDKLLDLADVISSTVYRTPAEHLLGNQLAAVIRKYPFPNGLLNRNPRAEATKIFFRSELKCKRVNRRFSLYMSLRSPHERALSNARSWVHHTLGDLHLSEIWNHCGFGPGASVGVSGNATNNARKLLARRWTCTPGAFYYARTATVLDPLIMELLLKPPEKDQYCFDPEQFYITFRSKAELIDYNKITFVPKTAKVERTIAVEPLLNGFVQKGIDEVMRKRLLRVGIDLRDQSLNQRLAREGSLSIDPDPYVTIDLSSASDSVSTELCRYMLPPDWFEFLNSVRSSSYLLEGEKHAFHKFTTMGNGFCFPLETLLFASLCATAYNEHRLRHDFSVYGDDIIVRQSVAARVLELLRVCGFTANRRKTFLQGPFRESCGADWFEGEDVRPLNLDFRFDSLEAIFKFCNLARSKGAWERIFHESLEFLESLIPRELCFVRPYKGQADTALEVPLDVFMASPFSRWDRNIQSWSWFELLKIAWPDNLVKRVDGYPAVLMRGALTGSLARTPFAERRKTRTKIRVVAYSGALSIWTPPPSAGVRNRPLNLQSV